MGRKSKLTEKQWAEVQRRMLEGEPRRKIADAFGITEAAIRQRLSSHIKEIKDVANQIVSVEQKLAAMPIATQITTQNYATKLRAISDDMLEGISHAASTFKRLSAIASTEMMKVDETDPMATPDRLKAVAVVTEMANNAAKTPINMIAANKDEVARMNQPETKAVLTLSDFYGGSQP